MRRTAAIAMLLLVGACSSGGPPLASAPATEGTATTSPQRTADRACVLSDGSTQARTGGTATSIALLEDVRINHQGCPRIVFEFSEANPTYEVRYQEPPFSECGSGDQVSTADWGAEAYLLVSHEPANPVDMDQEGAPATYEGSFDISPGGRIVKRVRNICRFEAHMDWVIGLDEERPFKVSTLSDPPRIVVDLSAA